MTVEPVVLDARRPILNDGFPIMQIPRRSIRTSPTRAAIVLLSLALVGAWIGCSPNERYKVLTFFFDGVPPPNALTGHAGSGPGGLAVVITHKPFADQDCNACHIGGIGSALYSPASAAVSPQVCLKCHQDVPHQYPVMHGPVAAVECLFCHAAHESSYPALLWKKSPDVCMQCHTRELLDPAQPEHMNPNADCLTCHDAHGGQQHGLLKLNRLTTSATTRPTTDPSGGPR